MRRRLTGLLAFLAYYSGLDALFYFLNRRCKRVLTFHNVFPDDLCRKDDGGGMSISVSAFRRIIREIGRRYRFSVDLSDATTATITFDDGFLNQYEVAASALHEMKVPAVLFVAGKNIDRMDIRQAPAVDLLTVWLAEVPENLLRGKDRMSYWIDELRPAYVADVEHYGRKVVEACDRLYPFEKIFAALGSKYTQLRLSGVTTAQLNDLRARGWLIGWHSLNHFALSAIPEDRKGLEFSAPLEIKIAPMSYPYGELQSVDPDDIAWAQKAGFPSAYSNLPEINPRLSRYFLPRFSVSSNRYLLHFHLSGLRHFAKFHRLLPVVQ